MPKNTPDNPPPPQDSDTPTPRIACFGEILWDMLPEGLFVGGAPLNVAYHLKQQGVDSQIISAVGRDQLGDELIRRLSNWHMPTNFIARHKDLPTGTVRATIGTKGDATYHILQNVAWDHIPVTPECTEFIHHANGLVFGSLALRSSTNLTSLKLILSQLPHNALRIFDVNLRPPHDDLSLIHSIAKHATLIKVNSDEAARLANHSNPNNVETHARTIAKQYNCSLVCVTAGSRGAGLLTNNSWIWENGRKVSVRDTVGAGDSFLATLIAGILTSGPTPNTLARACRIGEYVATQRGATPPHPH